ERKHASLFPIPCSRRLPDSRFPIPDSLPYCFPHLFAGNDLGRAVVLVRRQLPQQRIHSVFVAHDTHSPAKSASASRSLALARKSCALEVPGWTPSAAAISSCV